MLLMALMLIAAGTVVYAAMSQETVECDVKGNTKWLKTVDACKDLAAYIQDVENNLSHHGCDGP